MGNVKDSRNLAQRAKDGMLGLFGRVTGFKKGIKREEVEQPEESIKAEEVEQPVESTEAKEELKEEKNNNESEEFEKTLKFYGEVKTEKLQELKHLYDCTKDMFDKLIKRSDDIDLSIINFSLLIEQLKYKNNVTDYKTTSIKIEQLSGKVEDLHRSKLKIINGIRTLLNNDKYSKKYIRDAKKYYRQELIMTKPILSQEEIENMLIHFEQYIEMLDISNMHNEVEKLKERRFSYIKWNPNGSYVKRTFNGHGELIEERNIDIDGRG